MKRARQFICGAVALALALGLAGCGENVEESPSPTPDPSPSASATVEPYVEPAELSLGYADDSSLHPLKASDQGALDIDSLVYEGLYQMDQSFEPQPVLVEKGVMGADGMTWRFTVKSGAAFSDGTQVTAAQIVSCLEAARASERFAARLAGITSVWAEDEQVVVALNEPNGALPSLLDVPVFLEQGDGLPLGTGPYLFATDGETLSLRYNPLWWSGQEPVFDHVVLSGYASQDDRADAFSRGEVTAVAVDFNTASALDWSGTYETHDYSTTTMLYLGFNTRKGKLCSDVRVRTALSQALDRNGVVGDTLSGHGVAAALPVSPASELYSSESAEALGYDPESTAALLEEAGWSKNEEGLYVRGRASLSLTLAVNRDNITRRAMAEYMAQRLEEQGITVTLAALDWDSYVSALTAGNFDLYVGEVRLTGDFDITALVSGELNYGGFWSDDLNQAVTTAKAARGSGRAAAAKALYAAFAAEVPFAVLCFKNSSLLVQWGLAENFTPLPDRPFAGIESWQAG